MKLLTTLGVALVTLLIPVVYIQYHNDITDARQKVLDGSELLVTEKGEIEYAVEGKGVPVLLIHGAGGGYDQGLLLGKIAFGDGFSFVSVSRFGYLRSPFLQESSVQNQAALYASLLDHLGINRVIVFGASAGGPSALQFAHNYPNRTMALVLVSAVSLYMGDEIPMSTKVLNTIQKSDFAYWLVLKVFRVQLLQMMGISPDTYNELGPQEKSFTDEMLECMHPMSPRRPGNLHEAQIRPLCGEGMSGISVPTIILHAKDDVLVPYEHAEFVHRNIKQSELVGFTVGGHGLIPESKVISKEIEDFLVRNL
ncbi:hypothetical protein GEMRC1_009403 [Eukaryota sp. GEM-RC1]